MTIVGGAEILQKFSTRRADEIAQAATKNEETSDSSADLAPTPIFVKDGKFFFWDETWANPYGPFDTREQAQIELQKYAESLG
jgi:hypothetical protein